MPAIRAGGGLILDTSLQLCLAERRRLAMAFGLELGNLCIMRGRWTSVRSWESYAQHGEGKGT